MPGICLAGVAAPRMGVTETTREGARTPVHRLRELREARSLSQAELGAAAGTDAMTVSRIERGTTRRPHPKTVRALARALKVPVAALTARCGPVAPAPASGGPEPSGPPSGR
jgi:transcriptional regulator with XRE-family HTH domain